ncbi:NAD-dependent succinate-semialdehyde dehydrogenase [Mesonia aestuariivivens]|uniref:NAD-dependent succinate-semialdehyde dehydrogenase n=1 Tax=Mesonia aestuariivivens TaxID=2796128 RepID=A0ABS6W4N4_9FLAO|nr:NAD-dependent succinate-semialdehyde dehydrogenase [Mesonia aestuariivivens]MBW2962815.1 NAD-dependent succinate-semialdehyde dehydrogenase [Mesonia aestuariivivens]
MSDQIKTINPATEEIINSYELMSTEKAIKSVEECHNAFKSWRHVSLEDRAKVIQSIGKSLKKHKDELVKLMTQEMGKLIKQSEQEIDLCIAICEHTAKIGPEELKDEERVLPNGGKGLIAYSPLGVIYGIQPWNFPTYQVIRYAIANLMTGNGVLLKHAENVTGSGLLIEKILKESDLPENLFKVLLIDHNQSDAIIDHDLVRGVTLTGSPKAGRIIAEKAAKKLKKTVLELGSNDAYIVLKDADLNEAVKYCVQGRTYNNGETCVAAKRFIVESEIYDDFKEAYVKEMKKITFGDPTGSEAKIGPMAREDLRNELHNQVTKSVEKGAKVLCGGEIPKQKGFYYPATVLDNLKPGMPAYDDELFGPVASLIKAKDQEDAFKIANNSKFGLGGGIFTKDEKKAFNLAKNHFDTGMVFINSFGVAQPNMPFGGIKDSGYGREHGGFGMKEFVNAKAIMALNS